MEQYFIIGQRSQCHQCFVFFPTPEGSKPSFCSTPCQQASIAEGKQTVEQFQNDLRST